MNISEGALDLLKVLHTEREHYRQLQLALSKQLCENRELHKDLKWALGAIEQLRAYAKRTQKYWDLGQDHKTGKRLSAMAGELEGYDERMDGIFRHMTRIIAGHDSSIAGHDSNNRGI